MTACIDRWSPFLGDNLFCPQNRQWWCWFVCPCFMVIVSFYYSHWKADLWRAGNPNTLRPCELESSSTSTSILHCNWSTEYCSLGRFYLLLTVLVDTFNKEKVLVCTLSKFCIFITVIIDVKIGERSWARARGREICKRSPFCPVPGGNKSIRLRWDLHLSNIYLFTVFYIYYVKTMNNLCALKSSKCTI